MMKKIRGLMSKGSRKRLLAWGAVLMVGVGVLFMDGRPVDDSGYPYPLPVVADADSSFAPLEKWNQLPRKIQEKAVSLSWEREKMLKAERDAKQKGSTTQRKPVSPTAKTAKTAKPERPPMTQEEWLREAEAIEPQIRACLPKPEPPLMIPRSYVERFYFSNDPRSNVHRFLSELEFERCKALHLSGKTIEAIELSFRSAEQDHALAATGEWPHLDASFYGYYHRLLAWWTKLPPPSAEQVTAWHERLVRIRPDPAGLIARWRSEYWLFSQMTPDSYEALAPGLNPPLLVKCTGGAFFKRNDTRRLVFEKLQKAEAALAAKSGPELRKLRKWDGILLCGEPDFSSWQLCSPNFSGRMMVLHFGPVDSRAGTAFLERETRHGILEAMLAIRKYEIDHGELPHDVAQACHEGFAAQSLLPRNEESGEPLLWDLENQEVIDRSPTHDTCYPYPWGPRGSESGGSPIKRERQAKREPSKPGC